MWARVVGIALEEGILDWQRDFWRAYQELLHRRPQAFRDVIVGELTGEEIFQRE